MSDKSTVMSEVYSFERSQYDVADSTNKESLPEDQRSVVDGKYIIGRVVGPMFVPDGASRNDRWYPRELWEKVINDPEVRTKMAERTIFGSIGHDDQPFTDNDLRNGLASHITTKLWIDENTKLGMGECLILGTPTGEILLTALKAGSKLHVSSRAFGEYKPNSYHEGLPVVDPDTYEFHCFDWVIDPGFLQARPTLKEKYEQVLNKNNMEDTNTNKAMAEAVARLQKSNEALILKNEALLKENAKLKSDFEGPNKALKEQLAKYRAFVGDVKKVSEALRASGKKSVSDLVSEANLPSVKSILDFVMGKKIKLETLQGIESLVSSKNEGKSSLANAHRILKARMEKKDEIIGKAKALVEEYRKFGTLEELSAAQAVLEKYTAIGSIPDLIGIMNLCQEKINKAIKVKSNKVVEELAKSSGVEIERVSNLVKKLGVSEARALLSSISGNQMTEAKKPETKKTVSESVEADPIVESWSKFVRSKKVDVSESKKEDEVQADPIVENFCKRIKK